MLTAWLISASECFFAYRVYLIGFKSKLIACVAVACVLAANGMLINLTTIPIHPEVPRVCHVAVCIVTTTIGFENRNLSEYAEKTRVLTVAFLALSASCDYMLSGTIFVSLYRSRAKHARHVHPSSVLGVLLLYVLNTGLLVGSVSELCVRHTGIYADPGVIQYNAGNSNNHVYPITLFSVLNSRQLFVSRGIRIFNDQPFGREIISRANRLATVERWNVPQAQDDMMPSVINVKVVAEIEVHGRGDTDSSSDYDPKPLPPVGHGS
ncbi:hypothetical protein NUW54_g7982 [Trametes sanguinea]|uniref:Uncharacterized protein n=1 Tax=Trametes sanguinea TaxID=158606 RepID=A0ACC1PGK0_9APHY|nr:hypothetical protein NUW54_g7982 [Trametes sanguinea]